MGDETQEMTDDFGLRYREWLGEFGPDETSREDAKPHEPVDCNCWSDGKPDPECPECGGRGVRLTAEEAKMPSDEAMRTAKALWHKDGLGTAREIEARRAKVIDECLNLPTLLEVAKAAKEDVSHVEALRAAAIKAGARNAGPHNSAYIRLRAALAKLEEK